MLITQLEPHDRRWTDFLAKVRHDFYHRPEYAKIVARLDHGRARALLVEEKHWSVLIPLIECRLPGSFGEFWDAHSPYGYASPLTYHSGLNSGPAGHGVGEDIIEYLRDMGCVSLFLRYHPLLPGGFEPGDAEIVNHGDTVYCRLDRVESDAWHHTRSGHRSDIMRAERAGLQLSLTRHPPNLRPFRDLYEATMDRLGASDSYRFDEWYFSDLGEALGQSLILAEVRAGDQISAAALFVETSGIVEYHLSASSTEFRQYAPTKLLIHGIRRWARTEGAELLHLGGGFGGAQDHLFAFKAGFSGDRAAFRTARVVVNPTVFRQADQEVHGPGGSGLGTRGFFPSYRAIPRCTAMTGSP